MRRVLTLVLLALCLSAAHPIARQSVRSPAVVIKAARMFDGRSDSIIADAVIVVEGTSITAAGPRLAVPPGSSVIDLGDVTLLPGFIDAHTHLSDESSDDWNADTVSGLRRTVAEAALRASQFAERTLMAGFTTVRDVGSSDYIDVGLRNAIRAGFIPGPRMLVAVHALGARGGHCDNTGYSYHRFGPEPGIEEGIATGADQFRDAVRFQVKYGADVIKVCATGRRPVTGRRRRHAAGNAGGNGRHRRRGTPAEQAHCRSRPRRRRRKGGDPRRHRLDRARVLSRR